MELRIEKRVRSGQKCIAPFINGWNVWEIPEKEWTPSVQKAIIHAYELGAEHLLRDAKDALYSADDTKFRSGVHDMFPAG